jgi:hypothetical protein
MSASQLLFEQVFKRFKDQLAVTELPVDNDHCFQTFTHSDTGKPAGLLKVYRGKAPVEYIITTSLYVEEIGLESYMLMAFVDPSSALPHFAFDAMTNNERGAFHVDYIPRLDLGTHPEYSKQVFEPLNDTLDTMKANPDFSPGDGGRLLLSMLSPWTGLFQATPDKLAGGSTLIDRYVQHWFSLIDKGVSANTNVEALADRDRRHRLALYNEENDMLWGLLKNLIGEKDRDLILSLLRGELRP